MTSDPPGLSTTDLHRQPTIGRARLACGASVVALAATFAAAQVDFFRRHHPGIPPERYLFPQLTHVWLPGLSAALVLALVGWASCSRRSDV